MSGLAKRWKNWRDNRAAELVSKGQSSESARRQARYEAGCRQEAAAKFGEDRASTMDLLTVYSLDGKAATYAVFGKPNMPEIAGSFGLNNLVSTVPPPTVH
ncbi:hypothetical protein EV281_1127 [Rhizobium sp. BK418]|nr:hypothetical protein EV281_1127 [Rhizobium sp. BK418]